MGGSRNKIKTLKIGSVMLTDLQRVLNFIKYINSLLQLNLTSWWFKRSKKLTKDSFIWNNLNSFIYWWEIYGWFNLVGILYNPWRLSIKNQINTSQLMIVDVIDEIDQQNLLVCNLYINPTTEKSYKNKELIYTVKHAMEIVITQRTVIIVGGDWNNQTSKIRKLTIKYGIKTLKLDRRD